VHPVEDFDELLRQDIEAVVIASPAVTHYPLAKQAMLSGRDVFVKSLSH